VNTLRPIEPTATDGLRLPIGIGVGISRGLRMDAAPPHGLRTPAMTPLIAREAGEGTSVGSPLGHNHLAMASAVSDDRFDDVPLHAHGPPLLVGTMS
jgi:hypothetical protein